MDVLQRECTYFLLLCEAGSMTRAAELLGLQQAALSKAIKKLEDQIGKKLFIRLGRGVKPTEYGALLQKELSWLQSAWQERIQEGMESIENLAGVYKLAIHPTVAISCLSKGLHELVEENPFLQVDFHFMTSREALKDVVSHDVDFAVVVKPASHPELVIQPLHTERIGLYEGEKGGSSEVIYYHPEMVLVEKILKSHKNWRRVPIANYEVLAHVGKRAGGKTLLPEPVASRVGGLDLVGEFIGEVPLALIYRYDRVKTRGFEFLKKGLLEILR